MPRLTNNTQKRLATDVVGCALTPSARGDVSISAQGNWNSISASLPVAASSVWSLLPHGVPSAKNALHDESLRAVWISSEARSKPLFGALPGLRHRIAVWLSGSIRRLQNADPTDHGVCESMQPLAEAIRRVAQPRSHGPEEGRIPPLPPQERAPIGSPDPGRGAAKGARQKARFTCRRRRCLPPSSPIVLKRTESVAEAQFPLWELAHATDQPIQLRAIRDKSPNAIRTDEGDRGRRASPDVAAPGVTTRRRARAI